MYVSHAFRVPCAYSAALVGLINSCVRQAFVLARVFGVRYFFVLVVCVKRVWYEWVFGDCYPCVRDFVISKCVSRACVSHVHCPCVFGVCLPRVSSHAW